MSSINTNIAAMTALQSLNQTNKEVLSVQNRISTGLRVKDASDNAAYWSIATTMRSDRSAISTVSDALGLGAATVDIAMQGMQGAIDIAGKIKDKLVAARQPGLDRVKIQSEITQLQESLKSVVGTATFSGQNWLKTEAGDDSRELVASFSRDSAGGVSPGIITVDVAASRLMDGDSGSTGILDSTFAAGDGSVLTLDISELGDDAASLTELNNLITGVDEAIVGMTAAGTSLGAIKSRIDLQKDFAASMMNAIDTGIGQLVDANMNEESTRLQALQVRQQLGIQALSMANQGAQSILSLFR
jgi:flagellin